MGFHFMETEIQRTYRFKFEEPVIAIHPNYPDQEIAFTEASITLAAHWDSRSKSWKAKKKENGAPAVITLDAPKAKRIRKGELTKLDAFYSNGTLQPTPIRLDSIQRRRWDDDIESELRTAVVTAFWDEILAR